jgi:hypothetical protein
VISNEEHKPKSTETFQERIKIYLFKYRRKGNLKKRERKTLLEKISFKKTQGGGG